MAKSVVSDLLQIFKTSVKAVLPDKLIKRSVKYNPKNEQLTVVNESYNLQNKNVYLVGTGKAVQIMAREVEDILNSKIKQGIISIPIGSLNNKNTNKNIIYKEGAKDNLPDANAEETAKSINDMITKLGTKDFLLVLISGGGSALLPLPKAPIKLEEKTALIKKLANSGADIKELNTVRKRLSDLKGGELAIKAQPAQVVSLILSDIVEDPLDLIASGPTTENEDDFSKAVNIIHKYNLFNEVPESIKTILLENQKPRLFPKDNVRNFVIGSNKFSIAGALDEAKKLNYITIEMSNIVTGNVQVIAREYTKLVKTFCDFLSDKINYEYFKSELCKINIPGLKTDILQDINCRENDICLILGGELTVEVTGTGKGGRNQHLALEFSSIIHEMKSDLGKFDVYLLSAGTDGIDGPTDAAGAIGYLDLVTDARDEKLNINDYLLNNDSYAFYKQFRNGNLHVITGHTNTNVMDIHIIVLKHTK